MYGTVQYIRLGYRTFGVAQYIWGHDRNVRFPGNCCVWQCVGVKRWGRGDEATRVRSLSNFNEVCGPPNSLLGASQHISSQAWTWIHQLSGHSWSFRDQGATHLAFNDPSLLPALCRGGDAYCISLGQITTRRTRRATLSAIPGSPPQPHANTGCPQARDGSPPVLFIEDCLS